MRFPPALLFVLKAVLAAVTLVFVVGLVEPRDMGLALQHARLVPVLFALSLLPLSVGLEAYRWWRLVRQVNEEVRYAEALGAVLGGLPLGLLTPGRVGEYVGRAALLDGVPGGQAAALTFAEKMATLSAVLVGGLFALAHFLTTIAGPSPLWPTVVVFTGLWTGSLLLALLYPSGARAVLNTVLPFAPIRRSLEAFDAISQREASILLVLSFARYVVFTGQFVLLVHAFAPDASLLAATAGVALVYFAKSAVHSITLGDLGIREGAAVFFLGAYGVPEAAALDASLAVFAVNLLLPALVGIPLLLRLRLRAPAPAPSS